MIALGTVNGDTAAAAADDDIAVVTQGTDSAQLYDLLRFGRGNVPAPAASGILLEQETGLGGHGLGFFLGQEFADGLGGILESGILGVHFHLCDHGDHRLVDAAVEHLLTECVLQVITDVSLTHGAADGQGRAVLGGIFMHQRQHGVVNDAYLGAVAVGNDDLMAGGDQIHDSLGSNLYGVCLLMKRAAQSVAAQSDDDFLAHSVNTSKLNDSGGIRRRG